MGTLMTLKQVCEKLNVSRWTLEDWEKGKSMSNVGKFPPRRRLGGKVYWYEEEVQEWIDAQPRGMAWQRRYA